jgi:outer membrane lipoprotein-sorting protein
MRLPILTLAVSLLLAAPAFPQSNPAALDHVLTAMDTSAKGFHTAQANFTFDQYTKVVNDTDTQKGKLYFRRQGKDVEMAADFSVPQQYAIYSNGKAQLYNPRTDTVNVYQADKNRAQVEAFVLLGFGGGGHDLQSTYDVQYQGPETVNGIKAEKLQLTPKSQALSNSISKIILWIDPAGGISVQQQMFFPGGDYRLAKYSDIQLNQKLPESAFKLKTSPKTKIVPPPG